MAWDELTAIGSIAGALVLLIGSAAAFDDGINHHILILGGFYQPPRVWRSLRPVVYEMRKRSPENPRWMDIEYLVFTQRTVPLAIKRYSAEFRQRVGLDRQLAEWTRQVAESIPTDVVTE